MKKNYFNKERSELFTGRGDPHKNTKQQNSLFSGNGGH